MASLADFISAVRSEAEVLSLKENNFDSIFLGETFIDSIHLALDDIKRGADSDDFRDLAVANFLISAAQHRVPTDDVANFVSSLGESESFRESASMADSPVSDFSEGLPPLELFIDLPDEPQETPLPDLMEPLPPLIKE